MIRRIWLTRACEALAFVFLALVLNLYALSHSEAQSSSNQTLSDTDVSYEGLNQDVLKAIDRGLEWLKTKQGNDGLFNQHPGMTGLAITAFFKTPGESVCGSQPPICSEGAPSLAGVSTTKRGNL